MHRMKEEEPHVKNKIRMRDSTCFACLHLIACILWQSINPSLVFLIRKRLHATQVNIYTDTKPGVLYRCKSIIKVCLYKTILLDIRYKIT